LSITGVNLRKPKFKAPTEPEKGKEQDRDAQVHMQREQAELGNAYLITPDALLPFECLVKDDYGLTKLGYNYKVRRADVELLSTGGGGAKVPVMQVNQVTRRANAGLVASNLQFLLPNPLSYLGGKYHLAYTIATLNQSLRESQGYREGYAGCDAFANLLERKADRVLRLDQLQAALKDPKVRKQILTGTRAAQQWEFDFKEDDGFDVRRQLPDLKAVNVEKSGQQHYYLQIAIQAVDNNIETGKHVDEKGQTQLGAKKTNRNGYISFLVISENELLTQISLEEETLTEKLESAKEKVDASLVSLKDQMGKVADPKADMENVLIRMNEIRTAIGAAGTIVRDAEKAYDNILKEMRVNRVRNDRMSKIEKNIHLPLRDILFQDRLDDPNNPQTGSYPFAEEAFLKAHGLVEEDVNAKRAPNFGMHQAAMKEADRKLQKLSNDIRRVLDAMNEGIVEAKLIAILATIERDQINLKRDLDRKYLELVEKELYELINGEKDKKKDDKKPPQKQSSRLLPSDLDAGRLGLFLRDSVSPATRETLPVAWLRRDERRSPVVQTASPARNRQ
ncbi:MAG TPA: hypothetical protein VFE62_23675, partial [Gemmataceae bacterium]|nr:hypothetical protein [Gemmataceae bacterium]